MPEWATRPACDGFPCYAFWKTRGNELKGNELDSEVPGMREKGSMHMGKGFGMRAALIVFGRLALRLLAPSVGPSLASSRDLPGRPNRGKHSTSSTARRTSFPLAR